MGGLVFQWQVRYLDLSFHALRDTFQRKCNSGDCRRCGGLKRRVRDCVEVDGDLKEDVGSVY